MQPKIAILLVEITREAHTREVWSVGQTKLLSKVMRLETPLCFNLQEMSKELIGKNKITVMKPNKKSKWRHSNDIGSLHLPSSRDVPRPRKAMGVSQVSQRTQKRWGRFELIVRHFDVL